MNPPISSPVLQIRTNEWFFLPFTTTHCSQLTIHYPHFTHPSKYPVNNPEAYYFTVHRVGAGGGAEVIQV